jgi:hypothetical protein
MGLAFAIQKTVVNTTQDEIIPVHDKDPKHSLIVASLG